MNQQGIDTAVHRKAAEMIFQAGLEAVAPDQAINRHCQVQGSILLVDGQPYDLETYDQIYVIGAGKAAATMARAMEGLLGSRISRGLICVKYDHLDTLERITIRQAGHPIPDQAGLDAAKEIYQLASSATATTLVICLISGGGSALLPLPVQGLSLADKQISTQILLRCGATIQEINAVRKHLSRIKGGGLARAVYPATLVTLILSDVVGDSLDSIASGPCFPDATTYHDCLKIIDRYGIGTTIPDTVKHHLQQGAAGLLDETPKVGEPFFAGTLNLIVASNFIALQAARRKAEELGYRTLLLSSMMTGETRQAAGHHIAIAREIELHGEPLSKPACLLSGGETTVTVSGQGKGGRNQEFVLAAATQVADFNEILVFSGGTDGTDGPTDAAGAFADQTTMVRAAELGLDIEKYLDDNDAYNFFDPLDDLYRTGPTNTNVMDLRIVIVN